MQNMKREFMLFHNPSSGFHTFILLCDRDKVIFRTSERWTRQMTNQSVELSLQVIKIPKKKLDGLSMTSAQNPLLLLDVHRRETPIWLAQDEAVCRYNAHAQIFHNFVQIRCLLMKNLNLVSAEEPRLAMRK